MILAASIHVTRGALRDYLHNTGKLYFIMYYIIIIYYFIKCCALCTHNTLKHTQISEQTHIYTHIYDPYIYI